MDTQQNISGQAESATLSGREDGGPMLVRDAFSRLPLLNSRGVLADVSGQLGGTAPQVKDVIDAFHGALMTRDNLSGQVGTPHPLTEAGRKGTIRPMGSRSVTPKSFKEAFCQRLRAARVLKYEQAADFAHDLGIPANTYGKYESGRSLLPHHLIPRACELLDIDEKTLFQPERRAARKSANS
jgi:hypothetical protein